MHPSYASRRQAPDRVVPRFAGSRTRRRRLTVTEGARATGAGVHELLLTTCIRDRVKSRSRPTPPDPLPLRCGDCRVRRARLRTPFRISVEEGRLRAAGWALAARPW